MTTSLPHRPRRRIGVRCPDHAGYVYTVVFDDDDRLSAWVYTTLPAADRMFRALKRRATRANIDARITMSYTHLDCGSPHAHRFEP